jgi:hypothetical protein
MSFLDSQIADLKSGRFFSEFFRANSVGPLAQRYFLIRLKREGFLTPFEDPADGLFLQELKENAYDLDRDHVTREFADLEKRLRETSKRLLGSMLSRENKSSISPQEDAGLVHPGRGRPARLQKAAFWQRYHESCTRGRGPAGAVPGGVGGVRRGRAQRRPGGRAAARRSGGGPRRGVGRRRLLLDSGAARRPASQRLWNRLFLHKLDKSAYYDRPRFDAITAAFAPAVGDDGRIRPGRDGDRQDLRGNLEAQAKDTYGRVFAEMGFDLRSALGPRPATSRPTPAWRRGRAGGVCADASEPHVRDKLRRLVDQCVLLANIDKTKRDDPTVTPAEVFYVGLATRYSGDDAGSLRAEVRQVATGVDFIDGWNEED